MIPVNHPSNLQGSQFNPNSNPIQRHQDNKTTFQRFYQELNELVNSEGKLNKLFDGDFNLWYKKVRYWDVCKYTSNEENNEEFQLSKIKVSSKQFFEIMKDGKEIQFDLRSTTSVHIQPKSHHDYLTNTISMCEQIQKQYNASNNSQYAQDMVQIRNQYKSLFGFFVKWHFQGAGCRIVVLVKDKLDKDKMIFIYSRENNTYQPVQEQKLTSALFKDEIEWRIIFMKEIIKVHQCKQIYEKQLNKFKTAFYETVKNDFQGKVNQLLERERRTESKLTGNLTLQQAFKNYDQFQAEDMLHRWKGKSSQTVKQKMLMVEVPEICIKNSLNPKSVVLILKNYGKQGGNESYRKPYKYSRVDGQYAFYQAGSQQSSKCYPFQMTRGTLSKQIMISVEMTHPNNSQQTFFTTYTYYKLEGEDAFSHQLNLFDTNKEFGKYDRVCFIVLRTMETRNARLQSVESHHERALFEEMGQIPTKYRSTLSIDYNPNTYVAIRELLLPNSPVKLTKGSYQQCYISLVSFIQQQQNKSQLCLTHLTANNITNKAPMRERLTFYEKEILKEIGNIDVDYVLKRSQFDTKTKVNAEENKLLAYLSILDQKIFNDLCGKQFIVNHTLYKNLVEDLAFYKPLNEVLVEQLLVKFLHFNHRVPRIREFSYQLRYTSSLIPILQKYVLIFFNSSNSSDDAVTNKTKHAIQFFVFVLFLAKVYPYSQPSNLKNDLYVLRYLVQKKLSHYNDFLNRKNIGLENLVAPYLLNLFTDLSQELTFRIWDYLISSDNIFKARIMVAFTLLTYLETTRNLPIIPINQFMAKVDENFHKINISIDVAVQYSKLADVYFAVEATKTKRLQKLVEGKDQSIAEDKYLQRIILGSTFSTEEKQQRVQAHYQANKMVQPIKEIHYPLPRPNHFGHNINEIIIFIHNLNILQNVNLVAQKYYLRLTIPQAKTHTPFEIPIVSKNHFYNEAFKVPLQPLREDIADRQENRSIIIQVVKKNTDRSETVELAGSINYTNYHKDKAYKTVAVLSSKNKHNKGQTVLYCSFCLKSSLYTKKLQQKTTASLQTLSQKILDYQLGSSNEAIVHLRELHEQFEHIKNPLDEFSTEQNRRLQNSVMNYFQSSWLENSKATVEEIKTIFYHIFPQEKDKELKLQFSKIYEIFSDEHKMQHVYLSQILTRLVLAANISRKKKLTYLYCLGVHYQGVYSKKITSQTVNSMIRLILKQKEILNACPYEIDTCGRIVEAYFFFSSLKNPDEKTYFTEILQDWAYICTFKHEFSSIILGNARDLLLLRSLFDFTTIKQIQNQPECRFQIVYELQGKKYLWSAVVESKTFVILKRGTKFLNTFDGYANVKYLDSTQEYLYNCQNIIPLHVHQTLNYSEFTQVMLENELVKYALQMPSTISKQEHKYDRVKVQEFVADSRASHIYTDQNANERRNMRVIDQIQEDSYESWVLHRSQNCLESWRQCCIVRPGPVLSEIKYSNDSEIYTVSTLDLISMDEVDLEGQKHGSKILNDY